MRQVLREVDRDPKPKAVHQMRTTIRRTEALWKARRIEVSEKPKSLARQLAKLRRRGGKVRDLDIQIKLLSSLNVGGNLGAKARLKDSLEEERRRREKKLTSDLEGKGLKKLLKRLSEVHVASEAASSAPTRLNQVNRELANLKGGATKLATFSPEQLHEFRIRCKKIRYTAELLPQTPETAGAIKKLKIMQDAVGEWHDWLNLMRTAEDEFSSSERSLLSAIRNTAQAKFSEALRVCQHTLREISFAHAFAEAAAAQKKTVEREPSLGDTRLAAHKASA
ncbi:MAG TPA: CHAD domain-containing protein [Terriglobales bacterium]|nr:CHAD domain-containing protein [Terriglobales bacterium]